MEIVGDDLPILYPSATVTMNRRLYFQKCSEHVMGVHNNAPGILTLCGHNPKLSAFVIRT